MFIANYGFKHLVQKAAMVAKIPMGYANSHPYNGLLERAHTETLDFITGHMPDVIALPQRMVCINRRGCQMTKRCR